MERFNQFLHELGAEIGTPLYADPHGLCQLNYQDELHVQLQFNEHKNRILLATFLYEIPPGKYRENLLKEALVLNGEVPHLYTLAYSERNNQLVLFDYVFMEGLNGFRFFPLLEKFIFKAAEYQNALKRSGRLSQSQPPSSSLGIFGLK